MELKMNKSKEQYNNHKARAKRKGVIFDLTFDEWLKQFGNGLKTSLQKLFDEIISSI
mgnify:CR=1 FL=1